MFEEYSRITTLILIIITVLYLYFLQIGETPLHLASRGCKSEIVEHLIQFVKENNGQEVCNQYSSIQIL